MPLLHQLESTLSCQICRELLHAAVALSDCQHVFCSLCIRKSLQASKLSLVRKAICPVCRVVIANERTCLVPQIALQKAVVAYREVQEELKEKLSAAASSVVASKAAPESNDDDDETERASRRSRRSSRRAREESNEEPPPAVEDTILPETTVQRPPKRSVPYHSKKRHQLVELCEQEGLWTTGSTQQLIQRHQAFCHLYNAEGDSLHPKSQHDCVRIIHQQEQAAQRSHSSEADRMTVSHPGFRVLIEQLKERKLQEEQTKALKQEADSETKPEAKGDEKESTSEELPEDSKTTLEQPSHEDEEETPDRKQDTKPAAAEEKPVVADPTPTEATQLPPAVRFQSVTVSVEKASESKENRPESPAGKRFSWDLAEPVPKKAKRSSSLIGNWTCPRCTFVNTQNRWSNAPCEMCTATRPRPIELD